MGWGVGSVPGGVLDLFSGGALLYSTASTGMGSWMCPWWCAGLVFGWGTFIFNSFNWDGELDVSLVVCWTCFRVGHFYIQQLQLGWGVGCVPGGVLDLFCVGHSH